MHVEGPQGRDPQEPLRDHGPVVKGEDHVGAEGEKKLVFSVPQGNGGMDGDARLAAELRHGGEPDLLAGVILVGEEGLHRHAPAEELLKADVPHLAVGEDCCAEVSHGPIPAG